jgi:hypothetical protein
MRVGNREQRHSSSFRSDPIRDARHTGPATLQPVLNIQYSTFSMQRQSKQSIQRALFHLAWLLSSTLNHATSDNGAWSAAKFYSGLEFQRARNFARTPRTMALVRLRCPLDHTHILLHCCSVPSAGGSFRDSGTQNTNFLILIAHAGFNSEASLT